MIPNHYKTLSIGRNASKEEIKKAYRKLALQWHPDKNQDPRAHDMFIQINEAYLILSDDEARRKYNIEYDTYFKIKIEYSDQEAYDSANSYSQSASYSDPDLNNWTVSARKQAEKFAKMSFSDFAKLLGEVIIETGKQGATAIIYAISGVVGASAIFSFFAGIYYGDIIQIVISIALFLISVFGISFTSKRYKR